MQEKTKLKPNIEKIEKYQQILDEINNYKIQGTIIKSKEKLILDEEKPTEFFFQQENKNKTKKKTKKHLARTGNIITKRFRNFT